MSYCIEDGQAASRGTSVEEDKTFSPLKPSSVEIEVRGKFC